jgi:hypothetical protein
VKAG